MTSDIAKRITQASKAFGALKKSVFLDHDLNISTKRKVYQACVLSVLLYGSECWTPLKKDLKKMDTFHNRCVRTVLGISNRQQWSQRLSSAELRRRWGDTETASVKVMKRRLEWLGHLARMPEERTPKICLFSWLPQPRPRGGPRLRWRDLIRRDLSNLKVPEESWYKEAATSRPHWRSIYKEGLLNIVDNTRTVSDPSENQVKCDECHRCFKRESDKKRHKCISERQKPVSEQRGAVQCTQCRRWLRSRGGLAVHRCQQNYAEN